jgi:hypothetical protein
LGTPIATGFMAQSMALERAIIDDISMSTVPIGLGMGTGSQPLTCGSLPQKLYIHSYKLTLTLLISTLKLEAAGTSVTSAVLPTSTRWKDQRAKSASRK